MHVRSGRTSRFDASADDVWSEVAGTGSYRRWWPSLWRSQVHGLVAGDVWRGTVRPPLPCAPRSTATVDDVTGPRLLRATVTGDIEGTAPLELLLRGGGSEAHPVSDLAGRGGVLAAVAAVAPPTVRSGHHRLLASGARQRAHHAS